ncbi:transcription initiation factor IIB [Colletotrichum fioriniae]|nr:transcription initiation factor IIB [Colletotrichum fioriniae]
MSATLFYIFDRKKNAQFREACKRDPYLTRKEFARRRKLSALERLEEEELQRSIMIRKSLASRGPSRSNSCEDVFDLSSMQEQHHRRHHHHHQMTTSTMDMPEPPRGRQQMREHQEELHHGRQMSGEWAPSEGRSRSGSETSSSASSARRAYTGPGCSGVDAEEAGVPLTPESSGSGPSRSVLDKETAPPPIHPMEEITRPLPASSSVIRNLSLDSSPLQPTSRHSLAARKIVVCIRRNEISRNRRTDFFQSNFATVVNESFEPRDIGTIALYHLRPLFATSHVSDAFTGRIDDRLLSEVAVAQENTAKLHSPLFVQLHTDLLWTAQTSEPTEETYQAVVNKRKELRRRRKELRRRRKVFDEINNIYTAKPYKPKMLGPNGAATDENAEGFKDDLNCVVMCPDCKEYPPNLVEEFSSGDMVCGSCGLVVGDKIIDTRSEWRTFANDDQGNDDPSRVGDAVNPLLNGSQLETTIAFGDGRDSKQLARLQNKSQNDKASKSLMQAYKEIGAFCDSINLGKNVSDAAKHIFKLTYDHNFMKGKPQEAVIAGCIFIACRQTGVGRTFREIFQVTHVSKKEIGRVFKQLESFLQKIKEENPRGAGSLSNLDGYKASASTSAEDLCTRFCSNLNFRNAQKIENVSRALARKTSSVSELAGRSPLSVAAACIYMASHLMKESRTSKEIASVAGVSDGTIKTAYRFLYQARDRLIEKEWGADKKAIDNLPVN